MKKHFAIAACFVLLARTFALALDSVPTEEAQKWGGKLAELAAKIAGPQVKIEADPSKANGVHIPDKLGMIIVPQRDLAESEELAEKFKDSAGAALAYLFTHNVVPVVDGQAVDAKRLRTLKVVDDEGAEHSVYVHLLSVRQLADDDYRLYLYGSDKKPIVDVKFSEGTGPGAEPVAVEVTDTDEQTGQGTVAVTVFGKYQGKFRAVHRGK